MMEALQSWWEVPAIAHFCHIFQTAFKLAHFEIEELECALLQVNESPFCVTIEQLIMKLLQGCYKWKSVDSENWAELLIKLLNDKVPKARNEKNYIGDIKQPFSELPLQQKVDILFKLCELRLDADDVVDATKNMYGDYLRIEPVGTDHNNNRYWYFFGVRLYRESPQKIGTTKSQSRVTDNKKIVENHSSRSSRISARRACAKKEEEKNEENVQTSSAWSIVCHSLEDWENLIKNFKQNRQAKQLVTALENRCLPLVSEAVMQKEKLEKKRLIELAPRRTSSRIEKVKQQRELEAIAEEQAKLRLKEEKRKRQLWEEENRQRVDREERAKALDEKRKAIADRERRAKLREMRYDKTAVSKRALRCRLLAFNETSKSDSSEDADESDNESQCSDDDSSSSENENTKRLKLEQHFLSIGRSAQTYLRKKEQSENESDSSDDVNNDDEESDNENSDSENEISDDNSKDSENDGSEDNSSNSNSSEEQSEEDEESISAKVNSSEEENQDINAKFAASKRQTSIIQSNFRNCFKIQQFITYTPRLQQTNTPVLLQQPGKPILVQQRNPSLPTCIISPNNRTYSKLDQNRQIYKTNTPLTQSIQLNFLTKVPRTANIIRSVPL